MPHLLAKPADTAVLGVLQNDAPLRELAANLVGAREVAQRQLAGLGVRAAMPVGGSEVRLETQDLNGRAPSSDLGGTIRGSFGRITTKGVYENAIHASSNVQDAEREIKLWFKPNDMPPFMRAYPTEESDEHYYFKRGKLYTTHEPNSVCLFAPGDTAWKSDLEILRLLYQGLPAPDSVNTVAAKYLINERMDLRKYEEDQA